MFLVLTFTLFARLVSGIESCSFSIPTIYNLPLAKIELNTTENGDNESEGKIRSLYKGCQLFWERKANSHCTHCLIRLLSLAKSSHCAILRTVDITVVCMQSAERYTTALSNAVAAWVGLGELV